MNSCYFDQLLYHECPIHSLARLTTFTTCFDIIVHNHILDQATSHFNVVTFPVCLNIHTYIGDGNL